MKKNNKITFFFGGIVWMCGSIMAMATAAYFIIPNQSYQPAANIQYSPDSVEFVSFRKDSFELMIGDYAQKYGLSFDANNDVVLDRKNNRIRVVIKNFPNAVTGLNLRNPKLKRKYEDTTQPFYIFEHGDYLASFEISRINPPVCINVPTDILWTLLENRIQNSNN